jgi:hypothetical protein
VRDRKQRRRWGVVLPSQDNVGWFVPSDVVPQLSDGPGSHGQRQPNRTFDPWPSSTSAREKNTEVTPPASRGRIATIFLVRHAPRTTKGFHESVHERSNFLCKAGFLATGALHPVKVVAAETNRFILVTEHSLVGSRSSEVAPTVTTHQPALRSLPSRLAGTRFPAHPGVAQKPVAQDTAGGTVEIRTGVASSTQQLLGRDRSRGGRA